MHPKEAKVNLAKIIIAQYHSKDAAVKEAEEFQRVFSKKEIPEDIAEYKFSPGETITSICVKAKIVPSANEFRRLVQQGAVSFDGTKIDDPNFVPPATGILKAGSRRFLKIIL